MEQVTEISQVIRYEAVDGRLFLTAAGCSEYEKGLYESGGMTCTQLVKYFNYKAERLMFVLAAISPRGSCSYLKKESTRDSFSTILEFNELVLEAYTLYPRKYMRKVLDDLKDFYDDGK